MFTETAIIMSQRKGNGKNASRACHGPRVLAKARAKTVRDREKGNSSDDQSTRGSDESKNSKTGLSCLENAYIDSN